MAFDEGLAAYSRAGHVQPYGSVSDFTGQLIETVGELFGPAMDAAIAKEYSPEIAKRLVGKDPFSRYDDDLIEWDETEDPRLVDAGVFIYATEIDWDANIIIAKDIPKRSEFFESLFDNTELFVSELEDCTFDANIRGLCFEFSRIEMLLPTFSLGQTSGINTIPQERGKAIGRPPKWDWEGAMAHVIFEAQKPDGLPTGPGSQARIEGMIADWFIAQTRDTPSASQIRQRAAKIVRTLETPKSPITP